MNYKDTLLMPKTEFEMRGNLPKKEPKYVERWQENDMYNKVIQQNEGKDSFVFHDGPLMLMEICTWDICLTKSSKTLFVVIKI